MSTETTPINTGAKGAKHARRAEGDVSQVGVMKGLDGESKQGVKSKRKQKRKQTLAENAETSNNFIDQPIVRDAEWHLNFYRLSYLRAHSVYQYDIEDPNPTIRSVANFVEDMTKLREKYHRGDYELANNVAEVVEKIKILESLPKSPFPRSQAKRKDDNFQALVEYKEKHGHLRVNQRKNDSLGRYVNRLRNEKRMAKEDRQHLTDDLIERLDNLGFEWVVKKPNNETWDEKFQMLQGWKNKHGDCNVTRAQDPTLGRWVALQRENYKKRKLDENKVERLNEISFAWSIKKN